MSHIDWLQDCMAEPRDCWSLGGPGAMAEFSHSAQDALIYQDERTWVTHRGALKFGEAVELARPLAYETLHQDGQWNHGVALCLPEDSAQLPCHSVLTALGDDENALHPSIDSPQLYDLGLGFAHMQFCVQTQHPELEAVLQAHLGQPLFESPEMVQTLLKFQPTRVLRSALARIEVYEPIQTDKTPEGPHTHLLEAHLDPSRSHGAAVPIPPGWVPGLTLHPAHPLRDQMGVAHEFDDWAYLRFQRWLRQWGRFDYVGEQNRATQAIERGDTPESFHPNPNAGDSALKILLRKLKQLGFDEGTQLKQWSHYFDSETK